VEVSFKSSLRKAKMVKQQTSQADWKTINIVGILSALSDDKTLTIYNTIALGQRHDSMTLIKNMGITSHQYYSRLHKISKAGLTRKENGKYVTTHLGNVVYEAISLVGRALKYYWVLKAIESFQKPSAIKSKEVMSKLIDSLIDDQAIRKIIMDPPIAS
jgi:flagellar motor switch protein FliG